MSLEIETITTTPYEGQKPGTSGLRKKVKVFTQPNYTENFIQCILNACGSATKGATFVVGGDGRFYCKETVESIIRLCAANEVSKLIVGQNGILSTPAASCLIRDRKALGGIILTASHNPGGPDYDFGIKFNCENGGPAPDSVTNQIYQLSTAITEYRIIKNLHVDISTVGVHNFLIKGSTDEFVVEIVNSVTSYVQLMKEIFDFRKLEDFVAGTLTGKPIKMCIDSMNGVTGAYVKEIFVKCLGAQPDCVVRTTPLPDFGGLHPDPNLTYAKDLVETVANGDYHIGAAFDGDGDRNMILGHKAFFVSPGDSLAVIAHYLNCIPYYQKQEKQGFARSMTTSTAVDWVAKNLGKAVYEVPTGWKYFGNLMDAGYVCLCGEESFGTGSNHIREKDGIWAVLAWLSIMQHTGQSIENILKKHWSLYGRNYFARYDYEECALDSCVEMMTRVEKLITADTFAGTVYRHGQETFTVKFADNFAYKDPVDKSISEKQGLRIIFEDNKRVIMRLSGTGSSGATVRLYIDFFERDHIHGEPKDVLRPLIAIALDIFQLPKYTGRDAPSVIT